MDKSLHRFTAPHIRNPMYIFLTQKNLSLYLRIFFTVWRLSPISALAAHTHAGHHRPTGQNFCISSISACQGLNPKLRSSFSSRDRESGQPKPVQCEIVKGETRPSSRRRPLISPCTHYTAIPVFQLQRVLLLLMHTEHLFFTCAKIIFSASTNHTNTHPTYVSYFPPISLSELLSLLPLLSVFFPV